MRWIALLLCFGWCLEAHAHGWLADDGQQADPLVELLEQLTVELTPLGDACGKWAQTLEQWTVESYRPLMRFKPEVQRAVAEMTYSERSRYEKRLDPLLDALFETYAPCAAQADAIRAMEALDRALWKVPVPSL